MDREIESHADYTWKWWCSTQPQTWFDFDAQKLDVQRNESKKEKKHPFSFPDTQVTGMTQLSTSSQGMSVFACNPLRVSPHDLMAASVKSTQQIPVNMHVFRISWVELTIALFSSQDSSCHVEGTTVVLMEEHITLCLKSLLTVVRKFIPTTVSQLCSLRPMCCSLLLTLLDQLCLELLLFRFRFIFQERSVL